jgi:transcriptional regulator with XRE-family HTH domain
MKTDTEVKLLLRERRKGKTQEQAAARANMSVTTAGNYERLGALPSQRKQPRAHRTRSEPFVEDWPWIQAQLERDSALQAHTLFALLCEKRPGQYQQGQLRTLQRRIATWRALHGPDREVMFEQVHLPGQLAQSDFTHMDDLAITIAGVPFPHLLYHLVLTYSNVETVHICFSESFEALAEGLEACLWQIGGVPQQHRTDNLSAAIHVLDGEGRKEFTERYRALMAHYGMQPTTNTPGQAHQNRDVEQAHHRFKQAVDQALRVRLKPFLKAA